LDSSGKGLHGQITNYKPNICSLSFYVVCIFRRSKNAYRFIRKHV
jgi:hypothetical protein